MAAKGDRVKFSRYYEPRKDYELPPCDGIGVHDGLWIKAKENFRPNVPEIVAIVLLDAGGMQMVNPDDLQKI